MFNISNFFHKFKKIEDDSLKQTQIVLDIIKKYSGINLKDTDLEIKSEKIFIKKAPVFRNQIMMHKAKIEEDLVSKSVFLAIY